MFPSGYFPPSYFLLSYFPGGAEPDTEPSALVCGSPLVEPVVTTGGIYVEVC